MIDRVVLGIVPEKPHTAARTATGGLLYEEMLTREGFEGAFTYLYHLHPITAARRVRPLDHGWPAPTRDETSRPLLRRLYDTDRMPPGGTLFSSRVPILFNDQVVIWLARPTATDEAYLADGDGDEIWFVREGAGRLESSCGWLDVSGGDYVFVPKGMIHRWHVLSPPLTVLGVQGRRGLEIPRAYRNAVGQLRMDAPYTHRDFVRPAGPVAAADGPSRDGPRELVTVREGSFTVHELAHCPMDVVGWEGFVYPCAFPIGKFQPKVGLVHLPPTVHTTFTGSGVAICSFVPRPLDFHPQAIPSPYAHANVQCDEVIWYIAGEFTSRRGVGPGAISLHPAGIAHGPQPGAYEGSIGATRTNELAVMIDAFDTLFPTPQAANIESAGYHASWLVED